MKIHTAVARIIPVLTGRFVIALLVGLLSVGSADAQSAFKLKLSIDFKGGLYSVAPTAVAAGDRVEVPVSPAGVIKVYARAISIPGVDGQALVDLQIYESRGGALSQISSLTMPVYLGSDNSADVDSKQGKLKISAFVEGTGAATAAVQAPAQAPVAGPAYASPSSVAPVAVPPSQAAQPQRSRPSGPVRAPEGAVPVPSSLPAPTSDAAPVSGGFSPLPRRKTASLSGGSCHDLAFPGEG